MGMYQTEGRKGWGKKWRSDEKKRGRDYVGAWKTAIFLPLEKKESFL